MLGYRAGLWHEPPTPAFVNPPSFAALPPPPPGKTGWPWTQTVPPPAIDPGRAGEWPVVTIVTPSYRHEGYIEETIRSILLQGYPRLEYIVMDGGSKDETVAILQKYTPWITYWESVPDKGQCDAINKGFARSTGQILNWINSDDYLLPGALFKLAANAGAWAALADRERPGFVAGAGHMCDAQGVPLDHFYTVAPRQLVENIRFGNPTLQPATFFNRRFWEELGPFDLTLHFTFDWELWIRACARGMAVRCLPEFLAAAHQHEEQKTETGAEPRFVEMAQMLLRNAGGDLEYAGLVRAVARLRSWFIPFCGGPHTRRCHYGRWLMVALLQRRFRNVSRGQVHNLMTILGA